MPARSAARAVAAALGSLAVGLTALVGAGRAPVDGIAGTGMTAAPANGGPVSTAVLGMVNRRDLLFVGASYTASLGATSSAHGYAEQVGARLGWPERVVAVAGTGYLNPGRHGHGTFAERIAALPPGLRPGLVVVQGGRNDVGYPAGRLQSAVCATVALVRDRFARPQVVLIGNVPGSLPVSAGQRGVEHAIAAAARSCHVAFVDPIAEKWITSANVHRYAGPIPGHPNDAGYAYIADRVVADLHRLSDGRIAAVHPRRA
jgi:lysophospholipase L1-like esterase